MPQQTLCSQFEPTINESSATICKWCNQEKFLHTLKDITMPQQTAVNWFFTQVLGSLHSTMSKADIDKALEQAKQMEKTQIIDAYKTGAPFSSEIEQEEYYNETYNK